MKRILLVAALCTSFCPFESVRAESWAEMLGFAPGRKVVILNAREIGLTWETNESGKQLLQAGSVSSLCAVVTAPWFNDVAHSGRNQSDKDIGISIALTHPYDALPWRLLTSEQGPTSLVDADGHPWQTVMQFAVNANTDDVNCELGAQIRRARAAGNAVKHFRSWIRKNSGFRRTSELSCESGYDLKSQRLAQRKMLNGVGRRGCL